MQARIEATLEAMAKDVFQASLGSHKLSGQLAGFWACSCGYDCRIVFSVTDDSYAGEQVILLLDIGTHDEVY